MRNGATEGGFDKNNSKNKEFNELPLKRRVIDVLKVFQSDVLKQKHLGILFQFVGCGVLVFNETFACGVFF